MAAYGRKTAPSGDTLTGFRGRRKILNGRQVLITIPPIQVRLHEKQRGNSIFQSCTVAWFKSVASVAGAVIAQSRQLGQRWGRARAPCDPRPTRRGSAWNRGFGHNFSVANGVVNSMQPNISLERP